MVPALRKSAPKSFAGCFTCRSRKVRCDLNKPECHRCKKSGFVCLGYNLNLRWLTPVTFSADAVNPIQNPVVFPENNKDNAPLGFFQRRPVEFVVWDAKRNCRPYKTYEEISNDIDGLKLDRKSADSKMRGPFGVFRAQPAKTTSVVAAAPPAPVRSVSGQPPLVQTQAVPVHSVSGHSSVSSVHSVPGHSSVPSVHSLSVQSASATPETNVLGHDQLWLSNELREHALLTAAALNGDPQFLDFELLAVNYTAQLESQSDLLNLVFHRHSHNHGALRAEVPAEPTEAAPLAFGDALADRTADVAINPENQHLFYSNFTNFYYNNPYVPNEKLDIQLHALLTGVKDDTSTDMVDGEQVQGTQMPDTIMEIVHSPLQPKLGFDVLHAKHDVSVPTTALQVQPLTRYLLNYYVTQVADLMTVIPLTENPWKTIYFPRALMAIGELSALGKTSTAKNALLNALLAVAAFNLQSKFSKNSPQMRFFLNLGIRLRNQASLFVKTLLGSPTDASAGVVRAVSQEKYKDILCAVMSMISVDLVWGTMQDTNFYIKWCEKVIHTKMTTKKKLSPKARILHRIFSSMKLIQDSTCLDLASIKDDHDLTAQFGLDLRNRFDAEFLGNRTKSRIAYIVDNSRVQTLLFVNKKLINTDKNDENFATDALNGLPSSLISIFSETVRLLREKIYHRDMYSREPPKFRELVSVLQSKMDLWKLDWKLYEDTNTKRRFFSPMHEATFHHIMAFYYALTIYFRRLIQEVAPAAIQEKVAQTLEHLNLVQKLIATDEAHMIPLFWQGFIAGCEATSVSLQTGFKNWGADIAQYLGSYWGARQIMLEVWRRKRLKEARDDWVSVIQDWEMNLMLN